MARGLGIVAFEIGLTICSFIERSRVELSIGASVRIYHGIQGEGLKYAPLKRMRGRLVHDSSIRHGTNALVLRRRLVQRKNLKCSRGSLGERV